MRGWFRASEKGCPKGRAEEDTEVALEADWCLDQWGWGRGWKLSCDSRVSGVCWQEAKGQIGRVI